jgi:hypothetical protein
MKHLLAASLVAALLAGCSNAPKTFSIDNPTASALTVAIDGRDQQVPAGGAVAIELAPGAHTLHTDRLGDINFLVSTHDQGGLINPTQSDYVIASATGAHARAQLVHRFDGGTAGVTVDGTRFDGPYRSSNDIVLVRSWRAGVHDALPQGRAADDSLADAKIFAARDFVAYYQQTVEGPSTFTYVINPGMPTPSYMASVEDSAMPALPGVFGAHAGDLRDLYRGYLSAFDGGVHHHGDANTRLVYVQGATLRHAVQQQ